MARDHNYGEGFEVANKLEAFCGTTNATNGPAVFCKNKQNLSGGREDVPRL